MQGELKQSGVEENSKDQETLKEFTRKHLVTDRQMTIKRMKADVTLHILHEEIHMKTDDLSSTWKYEKICYDPETDQR